MRGESSASAVTPGQSSSGLALLHCRGPRQVSRVGAQPPKEDRVGELSNRFHSGASASVSPWP